MCLSSDESSSGTQTQSTSMKRSSNSYKGDTTAKELHYNDLTQATIVHMKSTTWFKYEQSPQDILP
jgi:hypothetical protein